MSNKQQYEQFSTNIDVGSAIGITRQHQVLLSHVAKECNNKYEVMTSEEKKGTWEYAEERYLSATSKVASSDILRLMNRQGNCMHILVTHKLKTTGGSYRAIKSSIVQ